MQWIARTELENIVSNIPEKDDKIDKKKIMSYVEELRSCQCQERRICVTALIFYELYKRDITDL